VPARYKRVTRTRTRRYSPSPPRYERVSRSTRYVEERRPSHHSIPPPAPAPSLPPPTIVEPPPPSVHSPPPPPETVRSRSRVTSRAPSVRAPTERAPSHVSVTREHYVEVESEADTSPSSSSSEDVRSKAPSRAPSKAPSHATSHHTRKTSRSVKAPETIYSEHEREREIRRERRASRPEYETYRYIDAPRDYGHSKSRAGSGNYEPSESRDSVRRETRVVVDDGYGRQDVRYRR